MVTISIRNNFPEVAKAIQKIGGEKADRAMIRALNASVVQGETAMARTISKEFRITVRDAKARLVVKRARSKAGSVSFEVSLMASRATKGRGMNLIHFVVGGVPKRVKKGRMRQLGLQIKRVGGRKQIKGAFVATNRKTGGTAVFIREGKGRMPVKTLTTIDVAQMFNTRRINHVVREVMLQRFSANFKRERAAIARGFAR